MIYIYVYIYIYIYIHTHYILAVDLRVAALGQPDGLLGGTTLGD